MVSFKCQDAGMDCPFETKAKTESELMNEIKKHYGEVHGQKEKIIPDLMGKIKKAIKK